MTDKEVKVGDIVQVTGHEHNRYSETLQVVKAVHEDWVDAYLIMPDDWPKCTTLIKGTFTVVGHVNRHWHGYRNQGALGDR